MSAFFTPSTPLQIGIHQQGEEWLALWFIDEKAHFTTVAKGESEALKQQIRATLKQQRPLCFIAAIPPHQLLHRTLIFDHPINKKEVEEKCLQTLKKHSPVPLEELWFDFMQHPIEESQQVRIDLFAMVKTIGEQVLNQYQGIKLAVLDTYINALQAGILYYQKHISPQDLYLFQEENTVFAFSFQPQSTWLFAGKANKFDELIHTFCQHHHFTPQTIWQLCHENRQNIAFFEHAQVLTYDLPLIPLGCALWQGKAEYLEDLE